MEAKASDPKLGMASHAAVCCTCNSQIFAAEALHFSPHIHRGQFFIVALCIQVLFVCFKNQPISKHKRSMSKLNLNEAPLKFPIAKFQWRPGFDWHVLASIQAGKDLHLPMRYQRRAASGNSQT